MSQGLLLGKEIERMNGEVTRKRIKISIPHFDNSDLIKSYSQTLIGRCLNPPKQETSSLLLMLPKIWKVEERVTGADLGHRRFQFHFDVEEDLVAVLESQPYHFDFWIQLVGIPTEFWSTTIFQSIGDALGETTDVDLDYGKMRVVIDSRNELCFDSTVDFKGGECYEGEEVLVTLKYERLFGHCSLCASLCHAMEVCPLNLNPVKPSESKDLGAGKHEERARSYKGVVINGDNGQSEKDKEWR